MAIPKTTNNSCLEPPDKDLKRFEQVMLRYFIQILGMLYNAYPRGDRSKGAKLNKVPADMPGAGALAHLSSRKDFLKMTGAAGLGAALGSNILLRQALALGPTGPTDPSFRFSIKANYSAFDVISDNFVEHRDRFARNQGLYEIGR